MAYEVRHQTLSATGIKRAEAIKETVIISCIKGTLIFPSMWLDGADFCKQRAIGSALTLQQKGEAGPMRIIASLTTIPSRIHLIRPVLESALARH